MQPARRPKLDLPLSPIELVLETFCGILMGFTFLMTILAWGSLPDKVPTHYGFTGTPDSYGDKGMIWLLPIIGLALYAGMTLVNRYPHIFNYPVTITPENAARQYRLARLLMVVMKTVLACLFIYMQWTGLEVARGYSTGFAWFGIPLILVLLFVPLIFYMPAARKAR